MRFSILFLLIFQPVAAQEAQLPARLELVTPLASCALSLQNDLDLGTVQAALVDTLSVPATGSAPPGGMPGRFAVHGAYSSGFLVEIYFPSMLTGPRTPLPFEGTWARATSVRSNYSSIAGSAWHGRTDGAFETHFRVGGRIHGLSATTAPGQYAGKITIITTCH